MGIIHRKYNTLHKENHARFVFFETFDDDLVVNEQNEAVAFVVGNKMPESAKECGKTTLDSHLELEYNNIYMI